MSEAPKKILIPSAWCADLVFSRDPATEIRYIRADIVEEMREALEVLIKLHDNKVFVAEPWEVSMDEAKAALAKLEDV